MLAPRWFYVAVAVCGVALTAAVSYRLTRPPPTHWEVRDGAVFDPVTGVECGDNTADANYPRVWECTDLKTGKVTQRYTYPPVSTEKQDPFADLIPHQKSPRK